jgi:hypothetical protein
MVRFAIVASILLTVALPAFSGTHNGTYSNACSEAWTAVEDTLGNEENYTIKISDETRTAVTYSVKHSAHVTLTGALRQRPSTVSPKLLGHRLSDGGQVKL